MCRTGTSGQKKRNAFLLVLLFIFLSGCALDAQSRQRELEDQKIAESYRIGSPIFLPFPKQGVVTLAKAANHWTEVEQSGQASSFRYLVKTPKVVYAPNMLMQDVQSGNSGDILRIIFAGIMVYPILIVAYPPFFDYSWVEVSGNVVDPPTTRQLVKSLVGKAEDFYQDLNRPRSEEYDSYNNEYLWTSKRPRISRKWGTVWKKSYGGDDSHFISVSEQIIRGDFLEDVRDGMRGQSLPALDIKQSRYESTRHYFHRVALAKQELASYRNTLERVKRKAYKDVESREKLIIYRLFVLYYGQPTITNINYDPDSRLFGVSVEGTNIGKGDFHFTLADRVMNQDAPDYEKKIKKASVKILLRVSGGNLFIDGGYLLLPDGTTERMLPFHETAYQPKDITVATLPKVEVPTFPPPKKILPNQRMKSEGEKILRDTIYFQGLQ